jgi:hypothetical protein
MNPFLLMYDKNEAPPDRPDALVGVRLDGRGDQYAHGVPVAG